MDKFILKPAYKGNLTCQLLFAGEVLHTFQKSSDFMKKLLTIITKHSLNQYVACTDMGNRSEDHVEVSIVNYYRTGKCLYLRTECSDEVSRQYEYWIQGDDDVYHAIMDYINPPKPSISLETLYDSKYAFDNFDDIQELLQEYEAYPPIEQGWYHETPTTKILYSCNMGKRLYSTLAADTLSNLQKRISRGYDSAVSASRIHMLIRVVRGTFLCDARYQDSLCVCEKIPDGAVVMKLEVDCYVDNKFIQTFGYQWQRMSKDTYENVEPTMG